MILKAASNPFYDSVILPLPDLVKKWLSLLFISTIQVPEGLNDISLDSFPD